MRLAITDDDIRHKAVELGLIKDGEQVPPAMRSKVAATLLQEQVRPPQQAEPKLADEIVVQPDGVILVDGEPFPWLVAREPMQLHVDPDGVSTVRLTLMAKSVQILKPEEKKEDQT